jgi:serine/threonine-protein kinase
MALKARVWTTGKVLLIAGGLGITYVVFATAAMRVALRSQEVTVPDLIGRDVNEALTLLDRVGLTLRVEEGRRPDATVAVDHVMDQDPPPNVTARRQRSVKVWVSAGPQASIAPALVGQSAEMAQSRLQGGVLRLGALSEIRSANYPRDAVVAQAPSADSPAESVSLLVNRGERGETFVMPDLIGLDGTRVADIMRDRGFRVTLVGDHPYPGVPPGVVLRQYPPSGFQIAPGEPISIEVSQ